MNIVSLGAACALTGALVGASLAGMAQSQPRSIQSGPSIVADDPIKVLQSEVTAQKQSIVQLEARTAALETHVEGLQTRIDAHPTGRHKAGVIKLDWNSVPDNAMIEYWDVDR